MNKNQKVDLKLLKKLRNMTLISYALCKEALIVNKNDLQAAMEWLKIQGISKAENKSHRLTKEGCVGAFYKDDYAVLMQIKCETDFVAKNKVFLNFFKNLGHEISKQKLESKNKILAWKWNGLSIEENILELSSKMGEKIHLDKIEIIKKGGANKFFTYNHNNKVCALLIMDNNSNAEIGESIAMHIVAMKPKFVNMEMISKDFAAKEKAIIISQMQLEEAKNIDGKKIPENLKEKIIEGKLQKTLKTQCLSEQKFVKNLNQTVKNYIKEKNVKIINMFWLGLE